MTTKRDLKRLVRERQARTGESYMTARRNLLAQGEGEPPPPVIPVVEMISFTEEARRIGMKCRVAMASTLVERADPVVVLTRVHRALVATEEDPGIGVLRDAVLRGQPPPAGGRRSAAVWFNEARRFLARVAAGIGGVSPAGDMLALHVDSREGGALLVMAHLGFRPITSPTQSPSEPRLVLTAVDELSLSAEHFFLSLLP